MQELKLKEPIEIKLNQYACPGCEKKFYINEEDYVEKLDCPFCDVASIETRGLFETVILGIFYL